MVESASVFLMRASPSDGMRARGFPMRVRPIDVRERERSLSDKKRASPSVDARGASRSPSDGMRARGFPMRVRPICFA